MILSLRACAWGAGCGGHDTTLLRTTKNPENRLVHAVWGHPTHHSFHSPIPSERLGIVTLVPPGSPMCYPASSPRVLHISAPKEITQESPQASTQSALDQSMARKHNLLPSHFPLDYINENPKPVPLSAPAAFHRLFKQ